MSPQDVSHVLSLSPAIARFGAFIAGSEYARRAGAAGISDFVAGNPQEMAIPAYVAALKKWAEPQDKNWFAYKGSEPGARRVVAATLRKMTGLDWDDEDVVMTKGASTALAMILRTVAGPGDEVIFVSPPWFFYEAMIAGAGATPVRVSIDATTLDLDLGAIEGAITAKTAAIIVNTPHNPTGKIYPAETLEKLASVLTAASKRLGHEIFLVADEAYNRILFDGNEFVSPSRFYPNTLLVYTYGKTLLTPGMRLGYIGLPPAMPRRADIRLALRVMGIAGGYGVPDALLQHALPDLEPLSIDIPHLERKRDRMVEALTEIGYELRSPEATFYLMVRAPIEDDWAFTRSLAEHDVFVLPGELVEMPGHFRISFTASDAMIDRSLPAFSQAIEATAGV